MRPVIVLFAKAPVPGKVKTRLCPPLTPEQAADLHLQFALGMLEKLRSLHDIADVELHTDTHCDAWRKTGVTVRLQCEGNLADRMLHAFREVGAPSMIVGADAPELPAEYLREILASESDVTLGPTEDGGYYAIACRVPPPEAIFDGVRWSTPHALDDTVRAVQACGLTVSLGRRCWDIDEPRDLARWRSR